MSKWLLRGIVFAALMVIVRLLQGAMIGAWEKQSLLISVTLVVLYIIAAFAWGVLDGQNDAKAQPDPDRREDLAMAWLVGGLFAGVVSGFFAWLIGQFYDNIYVDALAAEVTTFAAFTALLVFLPAILAVGAGRWSVDRNAPPVDRHGNVDDHADTDVFAAVRDESAARSPEAGTEVEQQTSAVALAEHDEPPTEEHRKD